MSTRARTPSVPATAVGTATGPSGCSSFKLRQLSRRVSQHFDQIVGAAGLKTTQYSLLSHVVRLGPVRPGDLAAAMEMDASTLTRNLQPLVAQGWVEVGPGDDGRSRFVTASDAGRDK
ncbi:MAG TPA: MarR family winged helix-turn-helix transcriptional regulator, partial [Burkholderiaceae bacterium]